MHVQMSASLDQFRTAVLDSEQVRARLRLAQSADDVVALASSLGFAISARDLAGLDGAAPVALTEPELDTVAGAMPCWCDPSVVDSRSCAAN